ncbi:VOC family protein [Paenibacillus terrigena]|uniref:VOC family protein n=1 Tax=Paenibacillus terrigena TaxID=369333 RepID=UPI000366C206|nr:VOC family protein [Paenibacillus terrigena]
MNEAMSERLIRRVCCNYIPVTDTKKSAEWYVKHFKFNWNGDAGPESSAMLYMREGAIFLIPVKDRKTLSFLTKGEDGSDFEMFTMNFEVDDESIDSLYQGLKEDGVEVTDLMDGGICGRSFHFRDLDGHKFSVVTPYKG